MKVIGVLGHSGDCGFIKKDGLEIEVAVVKILKDVDA